MEPVVSPGDAETLASRGIVKGYAISEAMLRMRADQVFCPVCRQPADETAINKAKAKMLWWHYGRNFPCVKALRRGVRVPRSVADNANTDREG